jgi:hypothetical protein
LRKGFTYGFVLFSRVKRSGNAVSADCQAAHAHADPLTMPAPLPKAHQELDRAVDRCYQPELFPSDRHRVEYLFALYEKITTPLVAATKPKRKPRNAHSKRDERKY